MRSLLIEEEGIFRLDFASQENRAAAFLSNSTKDASIFIAGKNIHEVRADELSVTRNVAKTVNLGLNYGMGKELLATKLSLSIGESERLKEEFWRLNPELREFKYKLRKQSIVKTPLYDRILKLGDVHTRVNWVIQGSCAELLWEALRYLDTRKDEFKLLPHFHDELIVKCLTCTSHDTEACGPILQLREEVEALYPFYWKGTDIRVFKLEVNK